jgi:hypothetical protein
MSITLLDHVIVTADHTFYSFANEGTLWWKSVPKEKLKQVLITTLQYENGVHRDVWMCESQLECGFEVYCTDDYESGALTNWAIGPFGALTIPIAIGRAIGPKFFSELFRCANILINPKFTSVQLLFLKN